jgi:hypothetical protein
MATAMITAIEIENFKGIRDRVRIEMKPITLLFGERPRPRGGVHLVKTGQRVALPPQPEVALPLHSCQRLRRHTRPDSLGSPL